MDAFSQRFTTRSIFLLIFGIACVMTLITGPTSTARVLGWAGLALYLLLKGQMSLFWIHIFLPLVLASCGLIFTDFSVALAQQNIHGERVATDEWLPLIAHYLAQAGLFISILTYPFSFLGVDPT